MARKKQVSARQSPVLSPWLMLLVGLFSGSALTALYLGAQDANSSGIGSGLKWWLDKQQSAPVNKPATVAPKPEPIPAPKFDFYHILETERVVPDGVFADEARPNTPQERGEYVLQVASYKSDQHADRLRAKLLLAGLEARVQKFTLADKRVVYRVVLGPYSDKRRLKNVRQKVAKLGLDAIALRSK